MALTGVGCHERWWVLSAGGDTERRELKRGKRAMAARCREVLVVGARDGMVFLWFLSLQTDLSPVPNAFVPTAYESARIARDEQGFTHTNFKIGVLNADHPAALI